MTMPHPRTTRVPVEALRAGDVVYFARATFRVVEDAWPALNGHGPSDVVVARAECLTAEVPNSYFWPGSQWSLQGRVRRVDHAVIAEE